MTTRCRSGAGAIRSLFQLMGRDIAYWYRRGPGVLVGEGRVAFRDVPQSAFASSEVRDCASLLRSFRRDG